MDPTPGIMEQVISMNDTDTMQFLIVAVNDAWEMVMVTRRVKAGLADGKFVPLM